MTEPRWVTDKGLRVLHDDSLAEHGGLSGIRDEGTLSSAETRARNLHAYVPECDVARLAAAYGFGLAKNHAFVDGNKRAALTATGVFLAKNGFDLVATGSDTYSAIMALASGEIGEEEFAAWLRANIKPR